MDIQQLCECDAGEEYTYGVVKHFSLKVIITYVRMIVE